MHPFARRRVRGTAHGEGDGAGNVSGVDGAEAWSMLDHKRGRNFTEPLSCRIALSERDRVLLVMTELKPVAADSKCTDIPDVGCSPLSLKSGPNPAAATVWGANLPLPKPQPEHPRASSPSPTLRGYL